MIQHDFHVWDWEHYEKHGFVRSQEDEGYDPCLDDMDNYHETEDPDAYDRVEAAIELDRGYVPG